MPDAKKGKSTPTAEPGTISAENVAHHVILGNTGYNTGRSNSYYIQSPHRPKSFPALRSPRKSRGGRAFPSLRIIDRRAIYREAAALTPQPPNSRKHVLS